MEDLNNVGPTDEQLMPDEIRKGITKVLLVCNGAVALTGATICLISGPVLAGLLVGSAGLLSVLTVTQDWQL